MPGKIALVDVDDDISASDIFMLELDNLSGTFHHMRFDAVLHCYAEEQQGNFHAFNLPSLTLHVIYLTRRQFVYLYKMVQISTFNLPPPQKEAAQMVAAWRSRR